MRTKLTVFLAAALMVGATSVFGASAANGKKLFNSFSKGKCKMCHNTSAAKKVGPGLAGVVNRAAKGAAHGGKKLTPAVIRKIISNPKAVSGGAKMPANKKLSKGEINDIVAYLKTL